MGIGVFAKGKIKKGELVVASNCFKIFKEEKYSFAAYTNFDIFHMNSIT